MIIINQILNYVGQFQGTYSDWVVGITNDPNRRFREQDNPNAWKSWYCESEQNARQIERYLLDLGFDGDTGGGEINTVFVYVYRK